MKSLKTDQRNGISNDRAERAAREIHFGKNDPVQKKVKTLWEMI